MLRFKGNAKSLEQFLAQLKAIYGSGTTIKEIYEKEFGKC